MEKLFKITTILVSFLFTILLDNMVEAQQYQRSISPQTSNNILDIEIPQNFYVFKPSPLRNAQSNLQEPSYFNFLSTLYRHDSSKASLFSSPPATLQRKKRAVIFRPLFVYRQQEVRKQKLNKKRRKH